MSAKYKFEKLKDSTNPYDCTDVTVVVEADSLPELVTAFERFLQGCGYVFKGELDFVYEEERLDNEE